METAKERKVRLDMLTKSTHATVLTEEEVKQGDQGFIKIVLGLVGLFAIVIF